MELVEFYTKIDGDYVNIKGRLRSDDMIKKFILKFLDEKSYDELMEAAKADNIAESIATAHKLKGVTANLSFDKLCLSLNNLLAQLREENQTIVDKELLNQVIKNYNQVIQAIHEL